MPAPIEMPATQSGCSSASASAAYTPAWYEPSAPPPLLKRMVLAGYFGKKAGKGFYDYGATPPTPSNLGL